VKGKYQSYERTEVVCCGASLRTSLTQHMPHEKELVESFDVTLSVTMLNGIPGTDDVDKFLFSEESALGAQLLHLCRRLREHKRAVVCLAGRAVRWTLPPSWDNVARKAVMICRSQGVPCIDGMLALR
jgi:hypothetical protein